MSLNYDATFLCAFKKSCSFVKRDHVIIKMGAVDGMNG